MDGSQPTRALAEVAAQRRFVSATERSTRQRQRLRVHDGESGISRVGLRKTVSLRALLRLCGHARIDGSVRIAGEEVLSMPARALRDLRGGSGDDLSGADDVTRSGLHGRQQIARLCAAHPVQPRGGARRAFELLELAHPSPSAARAYPHELSALAPARNDRDGAQLQPAPAARDEPTTRRRDGAGSGADPAAAIAARAGHGDIFVTHDLGVAPRSPTPVAVMSPAASSKADLSCACEDPAHPYRRDCSPRRARSAARTRHRRDPWQPPRLRRLRRMQFCAALPRRIAIAAERTELALSRPATYRVFCRDGALEFRGRWHAVGGLPVGV